MGFTSVQYIASLNRDQLNKENATESLVFPINGAEMPGFPHRKNGFELLLPHTIHSLKSSRWSGCEILKFLVGKSCNDLVPGKAILTKTQTTRNRKTGKLVFIPVKDGRTVKDTIKPGRRLTKPSLTKEASREHKQRPAPAQARLGS